MAEDPPAPVACPVITCQCPDFELKLFRRRWTATCDGCSERLFWSGGAWSKKVALPSNNALNGVGTVSVTDVVVAVGTETVGSTRGVIRMKG